MQSSISQKNTRTGLNDWAGKASKEEQKNIQAMKKILSTLLLMLMVAVAATAQTRTVKGVLVDRDTKEALPYMTVQLLKSDSTFVGGMTTKEDGSFSLQAPATANTW